MTYYTNGNEPISIEELVGKTLVSVEGSVGSGVINFTTVDGDIYSLYHYQNCCEGVEVEDINGDLDWLIGSEILTAEESTSDKNPIGVTASDFQDSFTWTFYKIATAKGHVVIRWYGESNGYYSESVDFALIKKLSENLTNRPQLHISMLGSLNSCVPKFVRNYGDRFGLSPKAEYEPPSPALIVGIAVHKGIELNMRHKMENPGKAIAEIEVIEAVTKDFTERWERSVYLLPEDKVIEKQLFDDSLVMALTLASLHYHEVAPDMQPIAVEEKFVITLEGFPYDLAGTIDLITEEGIRDSKTAKQPHTTAKTVQMALYSTAHRIKYGEYPKSVTLDVLRKLKTPRVDQLTAIPDPSWIKPTLARMKQGILFIDQMAKIKAETGDCLALMVPASPGDWKCGKKTCTYWSTCDFYMPEDD